jgi:hypothetical protein
MNLINLQQYREGRSGYILCLIVVFAASCIIASSTQAQTATYSDSFMVDNSGLTYDAEEDAWIFPVDVEELPTSVVLGVGVTDADYASYSESIQTTLTGPDGSLISGMSYDSPSGRVEVSLTPYADGEYHVQTTHRYWVDERLLAEFQHCSRNRGCIEPATYGRPMPLSFFETFTDAFVIKEAAYISQYYFTGRSRYPPPFTARLCVMRKDCGYCGQTLAIAQTIFWQACPEAMAVEFWRTWVPFFGISYCAPVRAWPNRVMFCH